ncbi:MAG: response regulator [Halobaculum sp.]|jgi:DNA-binding response OmpR family regulator
MALVSVDPDAEVRALVVDDEKEVADAYALRLEGVCETETAYTGKQALSTVESSEIDLVLLDRHMPGMSGDEVLRELRDREFGGRIIMVTAVDPDFEVIEMPFDDYLCKPMDREDLHAAVEHQRRILAYETLGEFFSAESKRAVLEAEIPVEQRSDREQYVELEQRVSRLRDRVGRLLGDESELVDAFDEINREEV